MNSLYRVAMERRIAGLSVAGVGSVLALGLLIGLATGAFSNYFSPPLRYILPIFIFTLMLSFVLTGIGRIGFG